MEFHPIGIVTANFASGFLCTASPGPGPESAGKIVGFSDLEIRGNAGENRQGKSNGCLGNRKWKFLEGLVENGPGNSYQKSYPGTGLSFGLVPFHFVSISYQTARIQSLLIRRGLIPCTSLGFSLTKSHFPKTFFRNSLYFSGQSYTNFGIIYL